MVIPLLLSNLILLFLEEMLVREQPMIAGFLTLLWLLYLGSKLNVKEICLLQEFIIQLLFARKVQHQA